MVKNLPAGAGDAGSIPGLGRVPWRREWQPTLAFLPGNSHIERILVGSVLGTELFDLVTEHVYKTGT